MTRATVLFVILACFAVSLAIGRSPGIPPYEQLLPPGVTEDRMDRPPGGGARTDTLWFGGDDGTGHALFSPDLGDPDAATWTWDAGGADPLEGWISRDMTTNDGVYFYRVTASSFAADPCAPMFPGEAGQLWCGMHEADAQARDWVGGMGYGNRFCQSAVSPYIACAGQRMITVDWKMFQCSEPHFDYTYVYVLAYDNAIPSTLLDEIQVAKYDGLVGSYLSPSSQSKTLAAAELPAATAKVRLEFRFVADGGYSDEDGLYTTACGPFAADDITITISAGATVAYDFETDAQGWTFEKCAGIGAFMAVWPEDVWSGWLQNVGTPCGCELSGNVLGCVDPDSPYPVPGHPPNQWEQLQSGICTVDRVLYPATEYNDTFAQYDAYFYMPFSAGTFYRPGFQYYPYTTQYNPSPHWSPRLGQDTWYLGGSTPRCVSGLRENLSLNGLPPHWEQMRYVFELAADCVRFEIEPRDRSAQGETNGAPLIDNLRIGFSGRPDSPAIALQPGHHFQDGFGQNFPAYLEPGDVGNANVSFDNSRDSEDLNDIQADSAVVAGPMPAARRWLCNLVLRVASKGPRQDMIPGYHFWKSRLSGDPEAGWVSVLMDSAETTPQLVWTHGFATYFHEDDPGFRGPRVADYTELNEILPDLVFTPGTAIRYYYSPYWTDAPASAGHYGPSNGWEFRILPAMRPAPGGDWDVEWPSVLYIDAYNHGSEIYITPLLDQLGIAHDQYDAQDQASSFHAHIRRSFINGTYGNNGMTPAQLLGYRLVFLDTGRLEAGALEPEDFTLLQEWLDAGACPEAGATRRGLILDGDEIAAIMDHPLYGVAPAFMHETLGARYVGRYRDVTGDDWPCVGLEPSGGGAFAPAGPVMLFGNDCPRAYDFSVIDTYGDTPAAGNLAFVSLDPVSPGPDAEFAQVVRDESGQPGSNWKAVVDGFSLMHVMEVIDPLDCAADSALVVNGAGRVLGPELQWITDVFDPFVPWRYACEDAAVGETGDGHLAGAVTYLYACRPNPFRSSATIRFHLARAERVELAIYDVTGRTVRTLVDGACPAGEQTVVWDGTTDAGERVAGGIFWMRMHTGDYESSRRIVTLR